MGAEDDGAIGNKTILAYEDKLSEIGLEAICNSIMKQRKDFYKFLVTKDPTQASFEDGWNNRLTNLKEYIA